MSPRRYFQLAASTQEKTRPTQSRVENNLVLVNRNPSFCSNSASISPLTFCLVNARSVKSKSADFTALVFDSKANLIALTETWLTTDDTAARIQITPPGYKLIDRPRTERRGGGIALLYRDSIAVTKIKSVGEMSFEYSELYIKFETFSMRLVIVYRAPYSASHPVTARTFISELTTYSESIILSAEPLLITGDFNLHVDNPDDEEATEFLDTLESMGLKQHVNVPTHELGHLLDLVITRQCDSIILRQPTTGHLSSDHAAVFCPLNSVKPRATVKSMTYRKLKSVDLDVFREDLAESVLCTGDFTDLDELVRCCNSTLSALIDHHAHQKRRTVIDRPRVPWFNNDIKAAIRERRRAERKRRASNSAAHLAVFKQKKNYATLLMNRARCKYYCDFIENNSADQGKLFRAVKSLLSETKTLSLPAGSDSEVAANDIGLYFVRKVQNIQDNLSSSTEPDESYEPPSERCHIDSFAQFNQLTMDDVREIVLPLAKKSCKLDPIPASMVIHCMNELLPVIMSMVNMSLQCWYFAEEWKEALVHPLPKKCGLDFDFKNPRPVGNLQFISKLTESAVADQSQAYMSHHRLYPVLQSAYRKHHSTETALLRVHNDILMSIWVSFFFFSLSTYPSEKIG